jgi:hypothetical protein
MDFSSVYTQAVEKTKVARATRDALLETPDEFINKVKCARLKVLEQVLDNAEKVILEAADRGVSTADIFRFNGNEFLDDVSVLFLIRGYRPGMPPVPPGTPGAILDELRERMKPFEIVHDWDGISEGNRIVARW